MKARETLAELKRLGTAQNRKVYARHGVAGPMFGVSYADLGKLRKKIRIDHELAAALWASGVHDARVLAAMVADPARTGARELDAWARDVDSYPLADAFAGLAARTRFARKRIERWTRSRDEWLGTIGWNMLAALAVSTEPLEDFDLAGYVETIERGIHSAKNRTRHAMNGALIAIGVRGASLQRKAVAAARRIGRVEVDHGETGCKTPDAASYIAKTVAHRRRGRAPSRH